MSLGQRVHEFVVETAGTGLVEITRSVVRWVGDSGVVDGLLTLHIRHTSASLLIQENADPEVRRDLDRFFSRLVPYGDPIFRHTSEGPDDMPAHVRSALTASSLSIPVVGGAPALGTWQGVYVWEHRARPHTRRVVAHLTGSWPESQSACM
ncbi:MAG TPA: secondary thiamine-phosphate synthase enzyme YjbQ [Candidatus Polarisedimenticolaceae bacterium]|nr:secondary thiamine-phosphate synthase enzyme YjbQ [Candidatus Polarisedimenticolaceae bacterium]